MFERFTEQGRQVVNAAHLAARDRYHDYIGSEHLLIGLLVEHGEPTVAQRALRSLGITHRMVVRDVDQRAPRGTEQIVGQIPFTPRTKRILEDSLREALSLGHNYIGPEHVLLALTRDPAAMAFKILELLLGDQVVFSEGMPKLVYDAVIGVLMADSHAKQEQEDGDGEVEDPVTVRRRSPLSWVRARPRLYRGLWRLFAVFALSETLTFAWEAYGNAGVWWGGWHGGWRLLNIGGNTGWLLALLALLWFFWMLGAVGRGWSLTLSMYRGSFLLMRERRVLLSVLVLWRPQADVSDDEIVIHHWQ